MTVDTGAAMWLLYVGTAISTCDGCDHAVARRKMPRRRWSTGLLQRAIYYGITDDLICPAERCRSVDDGHSAMRTRLASSTPAAPKTSSFGQ